MYINSSRPHRQTITVTCYSSIFLEVPEARTSLNGFYVGILAFCFSLLTVKYLLRFNIYVLFFKITKETNKLNWTVTKPDVKQLFGPNTLIRANLWRWDWCWINIRQRSDQTTICLQFCLEIRACKMNARINRRNLEECRCLSFEFRAPVFSSYSTRDLWGETPH